MSRKNFLDYLQEHPRLLGFPTVCFLIALWETLSRFHIVNSHLVPPASSVFLVFLEQWLSAEYLHHFLVTLYRMTRGYLLAVLLGIPLGIAMGYWRRVFDLLQLTIEVIRPIPSSALIPIAIIFFGISHAMHTFVVFFASFMPILLSTIDGVRTVDPTLIDTSKTLGRIFLQVILPAAMPHIVTGMRTSIALALIVAVSSEMIMSSEGLGWSVLYAQRTMRIPETYAGILALATMGYLINRAFVALEARMIAWHIRSTSKCWE